MFLKPTRANKGKKILFKNARVIDPCSGFDKENASILVEGSKIIDFGQNLNAQADEIIDVKGNIICPGLLDIQVHFREPGFEYKETIETGTKAAAKGGVTTVVTMPNTKPVIDNATLVSFVHERAKETAYVNVKTYGAITKGQKGEELAEMALMLKAGAVGFTDDGKPVMNAGIMRKALEYTREFGVPIAQHAEDLNLSAGSAMNEGITSTKLGVKGAPNAAEAVMVARDLILLELTGGHYHVLHISTKQAVEAVRIAKDKGLNVTAEAAPHHFLLNDSQVEGYRTYAKMNPPLRTDEDLFAIIQGLKDGTIDAIATDHAPHDDESKRVTVDAAAYGIVGLETMLTNSLELYHKGFMKLGDVLACMTYKPADIISVEAGRIAKGMPADLTVIDLSKEWLINPKELVSKSKNSPFDDYKTKGRAVMTIVGGEVVYKDE